jgi:hypothetical protein
MEKTAPLGAYWFVIFYTCYWGYQIKEARKICDWIIKISNLKVVYRDTLEVLTAALLILHVL